MCASDTHSPLLFSDLLSFSLVFSFSLFFFSLFDILYRCSMFGYQERFRNLAFRLSKPIPRAFAHLGRAAAETLPSRGRDSHVLGRTPTLWLRSAQMRASDDRALLKYRNLLQKELTPCRQIPLLAYFRVMALVRSNRSLRAMCCCSLLCACAVRAIKHMAGETGNVLEVA